MAGRDAKPAPAFKPRPVFNIGVVGHRKNRLTRADSAIDAEMRHVFGLLQKAIETRQQSGQNRLAFGAFDDGPFQWRCISGFADGTDRLAIQAAADHGMSVRCNLLSDEEAIEFGKLNPVQFAEGIRSQRLDYERATRADDRNAYPYRVHQQYLLSHCDLLVAVWDGQPPRGIGGTVNILKNAMHIGIPVIWIHAADDEAGVQWADPVATGRTLVENLLERGIGWENLNSENPQDAVWETLAARAIFPPWAVQTGGHEGGEKGSAVQEKVDSGWRWVEKHAAQGLTPSLSDRIWMKFEDVLAPRDRPERMQSHQDERLRLLQRLESRVGARYRSTVPILYGVAAFAVLLALLGLAYAKYEKMVFGPFPFFTSLKIATLVGIIILVAQAKKRDWHGTWTRLVKVTETMRIDVGLSTSRMAVVAEFMYGDRHSEDWADWLYRRYRAELNHDGAIAAVGVQAPEATREKVRDAFKVLSEKEIIPFLEHLLEERHHPEHHRLHLRHHRMHKIGGLMFYSALAAATMHLVWHADILSVVAAVAPAIGAALHAILNQEELGRLSDHASEMATLLEQDIARIRSLIRKADQLDGGGLLRERITDVANRMAEHHQSWYSAVAARNIELPA
jgi:hypothetical protein